MSDTARGESANRWRGALIGMVATAAGFGAVKLVEWAAVLPSDWDGAAGLFARLGVFVVVSATILLIGGVAFRSR